jgi:hypothetical protein
VRGNTSSPSRLPVRNEEDQKISVRSLYGNADTVSYLMVATMRRTMSSSMEWQNNNEHNRVYFQQNAHRGNK